MLLLSRIGVDVLGRSEALQQAVWSRAVQYGPRNMQELFHDAADIADKSVTVMSDADLIYYIYEVNLTDPEWTAGSPSLRHGLFARFESERQEALAMLA